MLWRLLDLPVFSIHDFGLRAALTFFPETFMRFFSSYGLTTIPLFILMGQFAFNAGISRKLYDTAYKFLGNIRGGLAMATVVHALHSVLFADQVRPQQLLWLQLDYLK